MTTLHVQGNFQHWMKLDDVNDNNNNNIPESPGLKLGNSLYCEYQSYGNHSGAITRTPRKISESYFPKLGIP